MNETMVKYLAGLLDSDGAISFGFTHKSDGSYIRLFVTISSSEAIDKHGFLDGLPELTGFGSCTRHGEKKQYTNWVISSRRDLEMVVPRLVKHMCVKAKHLKRMFEKWKEVRGSILSSDECQSLREFSKNSRYDPGPLKSKNHPSWAWVSGYLDGNGCLVLRRRSENSYRVKVEASCHVGDAAVLEFLKKAFGGTITSPANNPNCRVWGRNLGGADRSFGLRFLPKIVRHSKLKKHKIETMISHLHQQRLERASPQVGSDSLVSE